MVEEWIEEFLFRGRPPSGPDSDKAPTWHVVIGQQADSPLSPEEKVRKVVGPLSVAQAELAGWPLTRIVKDINTDAVKRIAELDVVVAERDSSVAELSSKLSTAQTDIAQRDETIVEMNNQLQQALLGLAERDARIAELTSKG